MGGRATIDRALHTCKFTEWEGTPGSTQVSWAAQRVGAIKGGETTDGEGENSERGHGPLTRIIEGLGNSFFPSWPMRRNEPHLPDAKLSGDFVKLTDTPPAIRVVADSGEQDRRLR